MNDDFRPTFYLRFGALMATVCRTWFGYRIMGLESIPRRPCLFVGNHSGIGIADVLCMLGAWRTHFGLQRRNVGLMHDLFVNAPVIGFFARSFGAVRADPHAARKAIARGDDVTVFPGGNIDSCRPITAVDEVRFGTRRGYVKLALETGVPIVPIATLGSHWSYVILPGGDALGRALGLRRFTRADRLPITLGSLGVVFAILLAVFGIASPWWIVAALVAAIVPTPVPVTTRVLPAIDVSAATAHLADEAERIEHAHRLVHGALVAQMTKRPLPFKERAPR